MSSHKTLFLVPTSHDAGLTSMALGLVQALQSQGLSVGFVKPISQPEEVSRTTDPSVHFASSLCGVNAPRGLTFQQAEQRLRTGDMDALMEEVVALVDSASHAKDVVVVEGLIPCDAAPGAQALNAAMRRSLAASLVPVVDGSAQPLADLPEMLEITARTYAEAELAAGNTPFAGVLVNKLTDGSTAADIAAQIGRRTPVLAAVPFEPSLNAPRVSEVVEALSLQVIHPGTMAQARVHEVVVAAQAVEKVIDRMGPGTLVVTPTDRSDVALAAALTHQNGVPLAGLLLTCGGTLPASVYALMAHARESGLPVLGTAADTYGTASRLAALNCHVATDDERQMEQVLRFIATRIDCAPLLVSIEEEEDDRMSPPVFRHRLIQSARSAAKRIVLPEGDEPRTIQAALRCHEKGIAHCVLLAEPAKVHDVARGLGLSVPDSLEIIDPARVRDRYVPHMVEMRKSKGMTPAQAAEQLEDAVVLGTMMLALDEVDGLVSGAVHTTANTVRPALQLIKTRPGVSLVSSVFFMLLPDQVLVYGDCAINPNPTAEQLAEIAVQSADSAKAFGIEPRVAMISYSTGTSGTGDDVEKVREATRLAKALRPDLLIDGPMQYDAASVASVGRQKAPGSPVAGHANVFIFPDLNTGNTTYKAVQRSANVVSVGPMLQGLRKPVNDLSRGALVDDIVYTVALTAIQATGQKQATPDLVGA
ncbi:phosphate acetyltransferase [Oleisolibacter albus]|uniref:phosphate acetyltransferase n=1 Tax=Oleisolibacter albus TaxID=2171757 RepID=UPI000DF1DAFC|nr:phosphate acetyltransferase [Oleisolibacter albus]